MKKRYQIFISSTFADLQTERRLVMQAVLEHKCFPAGMELFPAIDKEQFEYIKKVIDDSDYYLLIIGARYGSLDENGVSYTEKEYDYAVKKGIPVIAFLHSDIYSIPLRNADDDKKLRKKLEAFRRKVQTGRLVNYWNGADNLKTKVISSLMVVFEEQSRIGWVRAYTVVSDDSQAKIAQLEMENAGFKKLLENHMANLKEKEGECDSLEKSNREAQLKIKDLQKNIEQLQYQCAELKDQKEKLQDDHLAAARIYQEKVDEVAKELKKLLGKLGKTIIVVTVPGTGVTFNMVLVKGGTFEMGANKFDEEADEDEKRPHNVTLSDFYIGQTQVTQELWQAVMGDNPSDFKGDLKRPVERVSWNDCQEFIKKLNRLTGQSFHLPTEAQWEFAARGGNESKGYKYAGGDSINGVAWYEGNSLWKTHVVAEENHVNELGLYDMSGNVREWCQDRFGPYSGDEQIDPEGPLSGDTRVCRGGHWSAPARNCRVSHRFNYAPSVSLTILGLRLAL